MARDLLPTASGRKWTKLILIIIVIIILASSAVILAIHFRVQTTTTNARTCTAISAISYLYCPGPLRISAVGSPGATPTSCAPPCGSWNFTVTISSNRVNRGQTILLTANLTNVGQNITFSQFVSPYINPAVTLSNGSEVWSWDPPQWTQSNLTIPSGETITQQVDIPTSELVSGQTYYVGVEPISLQFPTPNNYTFTFAFSFG